MSEFISPLVPTPPLKAEESSHSCAPTPSNRRGSTAIIENPLPQNAPGKFIFKSLNENFSAIFANIK